MQTALITLSGMEDIAAQEVQELTKAKTTTFPSVVLADLSEEQTFLLAYTAQSARRVGKVLCKVDHKNEKSAKILEKLKEVKYEPLKKELGESFHIVCVKEYYEDDVSSPDIASEVAQTIEQQSGVTSKLKDADTQLILFITKEYALLIVDIAGFDLAKREYKIFTGSYALKAPLAYALVRLSGFAKNKTLIDPLCGAGIIPIEAAFFATQKPVRYFEKKKLPFFDTAKNFLEKRDAKTKEVEKTIWAIGDAFNHIAWTKKNAKIAGIHDALQYSRTEVDYLDAKFEENSVDCIVSYPPTLSKRANEKKMMKLYEDLCKETEFLLKKKGKLVLLSKYPGHFLKEAENTSLQLTEQRQVWQGKEELTVLVWEKE